MMKHWWSILCGGGRPCPASMPRDMRRRCSCSLSPSASCAPAAKQAAASACAPSSLGTEARASAAFACSLSSWACSLHGKTSDSAQTCTVVLQHRSSFQ